MPVEEVLLLPPPLTEIESIERVKSTIEKAGFSLTSLAPATSNKIQKTNPTTVTIAYRANQQVDITADKLYLIADSQQNEIFATIDADTLFDTIEKKEALVMYHNGSTPSSGYVNLNTIKTDTHSTSETILAEIQKAFAQTTLNNPTITKTLYSTGDDVNISYQTALKNQDETFECGAKVVVIDAQKGYSTLYDVQNDVNCTLGGEKISLVNVGLNTSTLSYQTIAPKIFEKGGKIESGTFTFDISSILDELGISKEQIAGISPEYVVSFEYGGEKRYFDTSVELINFANTTAKNIGFTPVLKIIKYIGNSGEKIQKANYETVVEYTFPKVTVLYDVGVTINTGARTQSSVEFALDIANLENVKSIRVTDSSGSELSPNNGNYSQSELVAGTSYSYNVTVTYNDGRVVEGVVSIRTDEAYAPTPTPSGGGGGGPTGPGE